MKTHNEEMKVSILALAVRCTLLATVAIPLGAYAADNETDALTKPTNSVDFGALYSSQSSAKFGEYNGLNTEGAYGLGGFDVRGGNGYDQSKDSALRWKLGGANLGTTSRSLDGSVSDQGKWKLNLGYDELQHNITDTYQTPLQGSPGGNNFTLPQNFGTINGSGTSNPTTRTLNNTQLGAFQTEQEHTTRRNGFLGTSYTFSPQLSAQLDYNHLDQSGAKLIGTGSQGGINLVGGLFPSTGRAEGVNILMNPTNYQTDNVNTALNWIGGKAHLTAGYYGSFFHDDYNSLSWQSAQATGGTAPHQASTCTGTGCFVNNTMSTAPSNTLHQANLTGGYDFSSTTKLAGGFSYGYNTQNNSYAPTLIPQASGNPFNMMQVNGLPSSSLNGVVQTTHGDLKLTNHSIKDLTLSTGFKFNERDNRTDSDIYKYRQIGNVAYTGVNTPYSNSKTQYEASAAYRLTKAQNLTLAYEHENLKRWCNGVVGGAQCVASPTSNEDKIDLTYRLKALEDVNFNAGYTYANRRADSDNSYFSNTGNYAVTGVGLANSVLNGGNYLGFVAYPYANRNQNLGKTGVNWQVTQKLDLGVNGRFAYDQYDATLGVQNGQSAGVNIDTTYNYTENSSVSAYWNWQNGFRNLRNGGTTNLAANAMPNLGTWTNKLNNTSNTFGLLARHGGLLNNKLEIIGDFSYALDASSYSTQVQYGGNCSSTTVLTCGTLPDINNNLLSLKLTGNYKVLKNGKVSLTYLYQQLNSSDYFYNGTQFGYTPNRVMPTGLQPQGYAVNVVALSYNYAF